MTRALATAALTFSLTAGAAAQSLNINFYASDGGNQNPESPASLEGPAGGRGETWNQFNTTRGTALLDTSGQPPSPRSLASSTISRAVERVAR